MPKNILSLLAGAVLLILGFMLSAVIFLVIAVIGLGLWGYFWWKTRALRKAMKASMPREESGNVEPVQPEGRIIEGEVIVVDDYPGAAKKYSLTTHLDSKRQ